MEKRVYGVLGISSIMANWNADFTGYPKTTSEGKVFGSDKALKYPMKKMWENEGKKVLYIKSMKLQEDSKNSGSFSLIPKTLKERYEYLFHTEDLKEVKDVREILKNLMSAVDVKNFGTTFAESGSNISITGAVQIGQGLNKYEDSHTEEQQILSPFRDGTPTKDTAKNTTLGTKIVSDEAHYFYPFVINPMAYKELVEMEVTEGYTQEDYENFKRTALVSATFFATNSKVGCENEFALFVETDSDVYLPNLDTYISFEKGEGKNKIGIHCTKLLEELGSRIQKTEIYYNPDTTVLEGISENISLYDIRTQKEV